MRVMAGTLAMLPFLTQKHTHMLLVIPISQVLMPRHVREPYPVLRSEINLPEICCGTEKLRSFSKECSPAPADSLAGWLATSTSLAHYIVRLAHSFVITSPS